MQTGGLEDLWAKVLIAVLNVLQVAAALISDLGHCPAELLIALWTLRGYVCEKRGQIDSCYIEYLQALSALDEAWGDPRRRGSRGHPFALLLTWKLGLISYCRCDVKSIDKYADYFRSLMTHYASDCPFAWGPPVWSAEAGGESPGGPGSAGLPEATICRLLWASEADIWLRGALWPWWRHHDVLNFGGDFFELLRGRPPDRGAEEQQRDQARRAAKAEEEADGARWRGSRSEGGIASDMQEVRRGTVFSFGSNRLGQLGVGRPNIANGAMPAPQPGHQVGIDLCWSSRPARVMALKEHRIRDIACGESHCVAIDLEGQLFAWGSDEWSQVGAGAKGSDQQVAHVPLLVGPSQSPPIRFVAVACGAQFSVALDRSGAIWTWGNGEGGVLGLGMDGLQGRTVPARLEGLKASRSSSAATFVGCGSYHALALIGDGELYSWGRAEGGQLGIAEQRVDSHIERWGLDDTCVCEPLRVYFTGTGGVGVDGSLRVSGTADALSAGLGGTPADPNSPTGSQSDDPVRLKQVAGGDVHSCGLDASGQVSGGGGRGRI